MATVEAKNPVWVECDKCQHRFIGLYLPMALSDAANVMKRLTCPMCANSRILLTPTTMLETING